jgi:integrase
MHMARIRKGNKISTREARTKNADRARKEPIWTTIRPNLSLGWRGQPGATGRWVFRIAAHEIGNPEIKTRFIQETHLPSDDIGAADGVTILNYGQAVDACLAWAKKLAGISASARGYTVGNALNDYLQHYGGKGGKAVKDMAGRVARLTAELGSIPADKLTATRINTWLTSTANAPRQRRTSAKGEPDGAPQGTTPAKPAKPVNHTTADDETRRQRQATANRQRTVLIAALNFAFKQGHIHSADAWRKTDPFKNVAQAKVQYLSPDEQRRLINAAQGEFKNLARAALLTGARYGELAAIRVQDVDIDQGLLHIPISKGGKARYVPLSAEGVQWFARWMRGKERADFLLHQDSGEPWKKSSQSRPMKATCEAANIETVGFHALRHSYATTLINLDIGVEVISKLLGHADTRMTIRHYAHLLPSTLAAAVAHLPSLGEPSADNVVPITNKSA